MANKLYQKQGGQLVEVPLGGSSQDLSQYVTSSAILPIVSSGGYVTSSYVAGATVSSATNAGTATKLGTATIGGANNPVYISGGTAKAGNTFVPNTGGTFSGNLHVTSKFFVDAGYIYGSDPSFSKGTTPSSEENYIFQLLATDAAGDSAKYRLGAYQVYVTTAGTVCNEISTYPNISGNSTAGARLIVWQPTSGTGSVTIPNARPSAGDSSTKVPDTAWVHGATVASAASAGTITSTLPVSKGGTGATTLASAGIITSGGAQTITGIKLFNTEVHLKSSECICTTVENGFTALRGGTNGGGGGSFVACGVNRSSYPGSFRIFSGDGTTSYVLMGTKAGALSWNGKTVTTSSDERIKTPLKDIPNTVLDAWEDVHWGEFKYLASVENKQNNARLHTGLIAQQIDRVFKLHGLDACSYGILCHEEEPEHTWEEEQEDGTKVIKHEAAVDLWMVRYTEALAIEAAYQRRKADRLEERVKKLEEAFASSQNTNQ